MLATAGCVRVGRHPVHAGDDVREGALPAAVEHAYRDDAHPLGDAVRRPAERAGDVRAVAAAVVGSLSSVDEVGTGFDATGEVAVGRGTGRCRARTRARWRRWCVYVYEPVEGEVALVDAIQAPEPARSSVRWPTPARSRPARPSRRSGRRRAASRRPGSCVPAKPTSALSYTSSTTAVVPIGELLGLAGHRGARRAVLERDDVLVGDRICRGNDVSGLRRAARHSPGRDRSRSRRPAIESATTMGQDPPHRAHRFPPRSHQPRISPPSREPGSVPSTGSSADRRCSTSAPSRRDSRKFEPGVVADHQAGGPRRLAPISASRRACRSGSRSTRGTQITRLCSNNTECSTSESRISQCAAMDVNGPM